MSEQVQVTLLTQLPMILGAIGLLAGVLWNIWLSAKNGRKLDTQTTTLAGQNVTLAAQAEKADTLIHSTETIHKLVNSSTDELKATIVTLRADAVLNSARIESLTALTVKLHQTIAALTDTIDDLSHAENVSNVANVRPA